MKNSEITRIVKDELVNLMVEGTITSATEMAAKILFLHIQKYTTDEDIKNNNFFGTTNSEASEEQPVKLTYDNVRDGLLAGVRLQTEEEAFVGAKDSIIIANNLSRLDKEALAKAPSTIVDLTEEQSEPNVDVYTVKDKADESVLSTTASKEEAKEVQDKNPGSTIYDSRARIVGGKPTQKVDTVVSKTLVTGSEVICENVNLYYKASDKVPGRVINGSYYLYSGTPRYDKYPVYGKNPEICIGWIKESDIS